jgi:hypothetical protein
MKNQFVSRYAAAGVNGLFTEDDMRELTFINLADAHLCSDCEAVGNSAIRCPRCQSDALIAVTRAMPRHRDCIRILCRPVEEKALRAA